MLNELFVQNNNIDLIPKTHEKTKKTKIYRGFYSFE